MRSEMPYRVLSKRRVVGIHSITGNGFAQELAFYHQMSTLACRRTSEDVMNLIR